MNTMHEKTAKKTQAAYESGSEKFSEQDLNKLMEDEATVQKKAKYLGDFFEEFKLLWALLLDYKNGRYTNVPWKLIAAVGFALVYLVSPLDIIPDFIPLLGYTDDIGVFGLVLAGFKSDIEAYKKWKMQQQA